MNRSRCRNRLVIHNADNVLPLPRPERAGRLENGWRAASEDVGSRAAERQEQQDQERQQRELQQGLTQLKAAENERKRQAVLQQHQHLIDGISAMINPPRDPVAEWQNGSMPLKLSSKSGSLKPSSATPRGLCRSAAAVLRESEAFIAKRISGKW
jgi:hypothetical protein